MLHVVHLNNKPPFSCHQDMTIDFNNQLREQEHEFNLKMDEMRAVMLSYDLKVRNVCFFQQWEGSCVYLTNIIDQMNIMLPAKGRLIEADRKTTLVN